MPQRNHIWPLTLLVLIVIGIFTMWEALLLPLILVGIVVFLYFFPPAKWRYWLSRINNRGTQQTHGRNRDYRKDRKKTVKLRVIKGHKNDDTDEPPRYH